MKGVMREINRIIKLITKITLNPSNACFKSSSEGLADIVITIDKKGIIQNIGFMRGVLKTSIGNKTKILPEIKIGSIRFPVTLMYINLLKRRHNGDKIACVKGMIEIITSIKKLKKRGANDTRAFITALFDCSRDTYPK